MTNVTVMQRSRTTIVLHPDVTIKTYNQPDWAATEISFYDSVPWACPPRLWCDPDTGTLITATLPLAANNPDYRPIDDLLALILRLEAAGISHRDIHPANIVIGHNNKPLLIDWECAIEQPGYDRHGPDSGVPIPDIHHECGPQWLHSDDPSSIKHTWGLGD